MRTESSTLALQDEVDEAKQTEEFNYYLVYPTTLFAFVVTMFFSITMPIIPLFGVSFFL